jgi:hypothetical protein
MKTQFFPQRFLIPKKHPKCFITLTFITPHSYFPISLSSFLSKPPSSNIIKFIVTIIIMDKKLLTGSRLMATAKSAQSLPTTGAATQNPADADPNAPKQPVPQNQANDAKRPLPEADLCYEEMLLKEDIKPIELRKLEAVFRRFENATPKAGKHKDHMASIRDPKAEDDTKSEMSKADKRNSDKKTHNAKLKEDEYKPHFTATDVEVVLKELNYNASKEEIDNMIWV